MTRGGSRTLLDRGQPSGECVCYPTVAQKLRKNFALTRRERGAQHRATPSCLDKVKMNKELRPFMMSGLSLLIFTIQASATTIPIDLGKPGIYLNRVYSIPFSTSLQGQSLSLDMNFNNSVTILPGRYARYFELVVIFATNDNQTFPGFVRGSGSIDLGDSSLACSFGSASSGNGMFFGLFPYHSAPLTFFGAHLDLVLPVSTSCVTDTWVEFYTLENANTAGFRIGPHVDDSSTSTFTLLSVALLCLACARLGRVITLPNRTVCGRNAEFP